MRATHKLGIAAHPVVRVGKKTRTKDARPRHCQRPRIKSAAGSRSDQLQRRSILFSEAKAIESSSIKALITSLSGAMKSVIISHFLALASHC